jgi:hypothetical protein
MCAASKRSGMYCSAGDMIHEYLSTMVVEFYKIFCCRVCAYVDRVVFAIMKGGLKVYEM